jgi:hypothetical protein
MVKAMRPNAPPWKSFNEKAAERAAASTHGDLGKTLSMLKKVVLRQ